MRALIHMVSQALSYILYPLFVPTYGMALFCYAFAQRSAGIPVVWSLVAIIGTLFLTCLLPLSAILMLMRRGRVSSLQIENPAERTMPYIYSTVGFGFWAYLLIRILQAPTYICMTGVGAAVALVAVLLINRRWKISAHLTGFGGLTGGLFSYWLGVGALPGWGGLVLLFALTLALMYARLYLRAHTPGQVVAGWLLGLSCTFLPYCMWTYVAA